MIRISNGKFHVICSILYKVIFENTWIGVPVKLRIIRAQISIYLNVKWYIFAPHNTMKSGTTTWIKNCHCIRQFKAKFVKWAIICILLQWRHNERDGVSTHRRFNGLLNLLFGRRSKKTSKLRVTGFCEGNSLVTGPSQRASNADNVSIWWHHHVPVRLFLRCCLKIVHFAGVLCIVI